MNQTLQTAHITPSTTLMPALIAWRFFLEDQNRSIHTIKAFVADLTLLAQFLPPDKAIGTITTDDLNQYIQWLEKGRNIPCSPKSLSRRITALKSFFAWLHKNAVITLNPADKVVQQSVISPLPEVLTRNEIELLYEAADNLRQSSKPDARAYVLFGLILETGIKKGECLGVDIKHLDLSDDQNASVFIRYANPANRFKERKVNLSSEWVQAFQEYARQYSLKDRLFPWSPRRLEYILEDLGEAAGLTKHVSFDMCRWTSALRDYQSGGDSDKIRQKLGISKIQWREVFMKLKDLAAKVN